jgi:uncharacterized membrane protein YcgQ (UPF0703/DUF1980 family)
MGVVMAGLLENLRMRAPSTRSGAEKLAIVCLLSILLARAGTSFTVSSQATIFRSRGNLLQVPVALSLAKNKDMSASEKERRDEDERRRKRKEDVVIGKTSAKKGEQDFPIDTSATEQEYFRQMSSVEREVYQYTEAGMQFLNSVRTSQTADSQFVSSMLHTSHTPYRTSHRLIVFIHGTAPTRGGRQGF